MCQGRGYLVPKVTWGGAGREGWDCPLRPSRLPQPHPTSARLFNCWVCDPGPGALCPLGDTPGHERPGFLEPSCLPTTTHLLAWNFRPSSYLPAGSLTSTQTQCQTKCRLNLLSRKPLPHPRLCAAPVAWTRPALHGVGFTSAECISHLGQNQSQWVDFSGVTCLIKEQRPHHYSHLHREQVPRVVVTSPSAEECKQAAHH